MIDHKTNKLQQVLEPRHLTPIKYAWLSVVVPVVTMAMIGAVAIGFLMEAAGDFKWND